MLSALALIYQDRIIVKHQTQESDGENDSPKDGLEARVANVTKALAPFLLPMIDALGALDEEQVAAGSPEAHIMFYPRPISPCRC